jgi:hypothetical protein
MAMKDIKLGLEIRALENTRDDPEATDAFLIEACERLAVARTDYERPDPCTWSRDGARCTLQAHEIGPHSWE